MGEWLVRQHCCCSQVQALGRDARAVRAKRHWLAVLLSMDARLHLERELSLSQRPG